MYILTSMAHSNLQLCTGLQRAFVVPKDTAKVIHVWGFNHVFKVSEDRHEGQRTEPVCLVVIFYANTQSTSIAECLRERWIISFLIGTKTW